MRAADPTWPGPSLLVPITVEAMVFTHALGKDQWSWQRPHYRSLASFLPVGEVPFAFENPSFPDQPPDGFTGVALHWALPAGITGGVQGPDGVVRYPAVPNRWLVIRRAVMRGSFDYRAWVVASDVVDGGGSSFPNHAGDGAITLGKAWPLDQWPGEDALATASLTPPLTAIGAGNAVFAAYVPNVENVFSFADALADLDPGPVSYAVQGWYGAPAHDPLLGAARFGSGGWRTEAEWRQLMAELRWSVGGQDDLDRAVEAGLAWARDHGYTVDPAEPRQRLPSRVLCHGVLAEVAWPGAQGERVSGVPTSNPQSAAYVRPEVAIGNSSVDAVAALIGAAAAHDGWPPDEVSQLVDVLEALQYDCLPLLDLPDGQTQLDLRIQDGWFSATPGGSHWVVAAPERPDAPPGRETPYPLTPEQAELLDALDRDQRALDGCARTLASFQWARYALWWKHGRWHATLPPPPTEWLILVEKAIPATDTAIAAEIDRWQALRSRRDRAYQALAPTLHPARLHDVARPPFHAPNEPFVVVSGARRSFKHGADGRFSSDGTLFCRFLGQSIDGIAVEVGGSEVIVDADQVPLPALAHPGLPAGARDLVAEAWFLDLTSAPWIAVVADPADPWARLDRIRREQTLIWSPDLYEPIDRRTIAELSGLHTMYGLGALPSKQSVAIWVPPWSPLFLDWEIEFFPASPGPRDALASWTFATGAAPDPRDDFTYRWAGASPPPMVPPVVLSGRTLLTPQATAVLPSRIAQSIERYADDPSTQRDRWALEQARRYLENADLLSQSLSGFNDRLLERDDATFRTPHGELDRWLHPRLAPGLDPDATPAVAAPPIQFQPIRGGHLAMRRLWVVDGFGQVFDVMAALGGVLHFRPVLGTDLHTREAPRLAELKPRVVQPSRIELALLSADDDGRAVDSSAGTSPVCGWLMHNRIDRSVAFYERDGEPAGELVLGDRRALWLAPPERSPPRAEARPTIQNPHLRAIAEGIFDAPDPRRALEDLLALFDDASWAVAGDRWAEGALPLIAGEPIAVVRAQVAFALADQPAVSQRWIDTGRDVTGGFTEVPLPIQLGSTELLDDGLIGFYVNDDYGHIDSVYAPTPAHDYVRAGRPSLPLDGTRALLTLVMAPLSRVHVLTGVLPPRTLELPAELVKPDLSRMRLLLRGGPAVNAAARAIMPLPHVEHGAWSWLQYHDTRAVARAQAVAAADALAELPDAPPVVREGWLKLILDGAPTRFSYAVSPAAVAVTRTHGGWSTVILQLTIYNGSGEDVACEQLRFQVPVGDGEHALTERPELIVPSLPPAASWTVESDGRGAILLRPAPPVAGLARGETLRLGLAGVQINVAPGAVEIAIDETTDQLRRTAVTVAKVMP